MKNGVRQKVVALIMVVAMMVSVIIVPVIITNAAPAESISGKDYIGNNYKAATGITLSGTAHVQSYGDLPGAWNAATGTLTLGTIGEGKRLEEINISMSDNTGKSGSLVYRVHRQTYGWTDGWTAMGKNAGTRGEGKRLEAIEIKLTGEWAEAYSVVYSAHIQTYGWNQGPVCDGAVAGTSTESKRVECIQVRIVPKGTVQMGIQYRVHRQTYGWEGSDGKSPMYIKNGAVSGTTGQGKRLEGIEINLIGNQYSGNIEYRTHVQSYGWESKYSENGEMSGTSGKAKRLEAIQIKLTGKIADYYDVYYRVHAQSYGWLAWAKNDEISGTAGLSKRLEAIQIVLVKKNGTKPGNTYGGVTSTSNKSYVTSNDTQSGSQSGTQSGSSSEPNINCNSITLYAMNSWAEKYISIDSKFNQSYQIKVTGANKVSYKVSSGNSVKVSQNGYVEPNATIWYWNGNIGSTASSGNPNEVVEKDINYGDSVITVTADNKTFTVKVSVKDYVSYYVDKKIDDYIKANVKSSMTDEEKITTAAEMAASYDYGTSSSSAAGMIVKGSGTCWASTDLIIKYCTKLGYEAWSRNGNRDPGAGSGHINALVKVKNGDIYKLDAGYVGNAPRYYYVGKKDSLYDYKSVSDGIEIYQYSGNDKPEKMIIPDKINGNTVVAIGDEFISMNSKVKEVVIPDTVKSIGESAFYSCTSLTTFNIPAAVNSIGVRAFTNCGKLTNFTCDESNKSYTIVNGVLYNKNKDTVVACPAAKIVSLPSTVKKIEKYSFYYNHNITSIRLNEGVEEINEGAFRDCTLLKSIIIPATVTNLGDYAFAQSGLTDITFKGNCPKFQISSGNSSSNAFMSLTANVNYYTNKAGYNVDTKQNYGGTIKWISK